MTATFRVINWGAIPIGALLGGALAGSIGPRTVLMLAAAGGLLAAVPMLRSPVRRLRAIPGEPPERLGTATLKSL
ncbi:hypothetical protein ACFVMC_28935 [Nocardia sp. NPDC127579]|uniref:hypothetical protein n=1 Tax=Nocardia sp. NPDC127579 TaxID=3345402 RepID=UPI00363E29F7